MLFSSLFHEGGKNTTNQQVQHFFSVSLLEVTAVCQGCIHDDTFLNILFHGCTRTFSGINLSDVLRMRTNRSEGDDEQLLCIEW